MNVHEPYIEGQQTPPWRVWKSVRGSDGAESGVLMSGYLNGCRGRVSPNHEGGKFGWSALVFDGTQEGFLAADRLGKFENVHDAEDACVRALELTLKTSTAAERTSSESQAQTATEQTQSGEPQ